MGIQDNTTSNSKYLSMPTGNETKLASKPKQVIRNGLQRCKTLAKIGLAISIGTVSVLLPSQSQKAQATTRANIVNNWAVDSSQSKVITESKLFALQRNPLARLNITQNIYKNFSSQLPVTKLDRQITLAPTAGISNLIETNNSENTQLGGLITPNWSSATKPLFNPHRRLDDQQVQIPRPPLEQSSPNAIKGTDPHQNQVVILPEAESKEYIFKIPSLETSKTQPDRLSGSTNQKLVAQNRLTQVHIVQPGETLNQIAERYGISRQQLIEANKIYNPNLIFVSQRLRIPQSNQQPRPNFQAREQKYPNKTIVQNSDRTNDTTQPNILPQLSGLDNSVTETEEDTVANPLGMTIQLSATITPKLPPLSSPEQYLPEAPAEFEGYIWPARGTLTSGYGWRWGRPHKGIDIAAPIGTPIMAAASGEVISAGWNSGGYGNLVKIKHPNGNVTLYAHNHKIMVRRGQKVQQGQQIAQMGSTGFSTGSHLHFEIRPNGRAAVNPIAYLPKR